MAQQISEVIRGWLGWCPQASYRKTRTLTDTVSEHYPSKPVPLEPPAPVPVTTAPTEEKKSCPENILLLLLLVAGFFTLIDLKWIVGFGIVCAVAVYYDAITLHAGEKFPVESVLGNVVTWRPLTWAVCVLIIPLIFLIFYFFSRQEIWDANAGSR